MSPKYSTWHNDSVTTLLGKLGFLPSSPPSQKNGHSMQAKTARGMVCALKHRENQNNPAGIKIPANAPSRGGCLLSCWLRVLSQNLPKDEGLCRNRGGWGHPPLAASSWCQPSVPSGISAVRGTQLEWDGVSSGLGPSSTVLDAFEAFTAKLFLPLADVGRQEYRGSRGKPQEYLLALALALAEPPTEF